MAPQISDAEHILWGPVRSTPEVYLIGVGMISEANIFRERRVAGAKLAKFFLARPKNGQLRPPRPLLENQKCQKQNKIVTGGDDPIIHLSLNKARKD